MDDHRWWQDGVIYQVYPRSFLDTNHDGIGDLGGVTEKLDYVSQLGVDAIWLSPFYPTPDADFGYDISDHTQVDARFGTMRDFDNLLEQAHKRGIRVIFDIATNHISDQHIWFQEARKSKDNPYRNFFIWSKDAKEYADARIIFYGIEKSNWKKEGDEYYFHRFFDF